jgi:phosphodiesterase/alkaline phosphatase D-like protein
MNARRLISVALPMLCVAAGTLVLASAPAGAVIIHERLSELTGFNKVKAVALDGGDLYVLEAGGVDRVNLFGAPVDFSASKPYIEGSRLTGTPAGSFLEPRGLAVDDSTGEIYVADGLGHVVDVFNSSGEYVSQLTGTPSRAPLSGNFAEPYGLTFDQATKELYVADDGDGVVDGFSSSGEYVSQLGGGLLSLNFVESVAVNEFTGNVYVGISEHNNSAIVILSPTGSFAPITWHGARSPSELPAAIRPDVSVDQVTGHVYLSNGEEFGSSTTEEYLGIAPGGGIATDTDPVTGDVYVPAGETVGVYSPDLVAAEVSTGATSSVTRSTATLEGVVQPGEFAVSGCEFEYRAAAESTYSHTVACAQPAPLTGSSPIAVSANVTGLMGGTVYFYRLVATNANATNHGSARSFTTAPAVDALSTGAAENVGKTAATLTGKLSPDGADTHYYFEYGLESYGALPNGEYGLIISYEATSPAPPGADAGSAPESVHAEAALSGLTPGASYDYRLVGVDSFGTTYGSTDSFTTPPAVDALSTGLAEDVSETGAKLAGSLSPDGQDAHYYFEYGTTAAYGSVSPELPGTDAGSASAGVHAETALSGLTPTTLYHYRLVGVNSLGTTYGADATFSTPGPPTIPLEVAEKVGSGKATLQAEIDPGGAATTYQFEYGETESYGMSVPIPPGSLAAGNASVSLPATLVTGLKANTTYHFRVQASNEHGTLDGPDQTFTTLPAAYVESEFSAGVTASSATLHAQVNPLGTDTTVDFQYGTVSCTTSPGSCVSEGSDIGSAEGTQAVSFQAQDLAPNTKYYYRVAVINELGTIYGPDRTFTTQMAPTKAAPLPDGRQYELVSPPQKDGAEILGMGGGGETAALGDATQASEDGTSVTYIANAPVGEDSPGNTWSTQILSKREAGGWSSQNIEVPHRNALEYAGGALFDEGEEYQLFSSDLSRAVFQSPHTTREPSLAPEVHQETRGNEEIYLRNDATGTFQALQTTEPLRFPLSFVDASPDLSHVVFEGPTGLDPKYPQYGGLYEWVGGQVHLVSVLPTGEPVSGAKLAGENGAVSNDGRVVWKADDHMYSSDIATGATVQVDLPQGGSGEGGGLGPRFQTASSDGSRIFFVDLAELTPNPSGLNLYMFDVGDGKLTDLTPVEGAGASNLLGIGEGGTTAYLLTSGGVLTSEPNAEGNHAEEFGNNLFALRETPVGSGSWSTKFVGTLSETDVAGYTLAFKLTQGHGSPYEGWAFQASPNGGYFAFMSNASLTGYDNHDANSGAEDEEVYLYDAEANRLVCASCNPTGARPVGEFVTGEFPGTPIDPWNVWTGHTLAAAVPGWTPHTKYQPRFLSNAGRLFFDSVDPLVPRDVNGKPDVYEYEPDDVGSCGYSPGCVALISAGTGNGYSIFFDASASGSNVFFTTQDGLVPEDKDGTSDMYDARVCTAAEPCPSSIATSPPCTTADSCRAAPAPQPGVFGASGSATFAGAGNASSGTTTVAKAKVKAKAKSKSQTRAAKLAKALGACRSKSRSKRKSCVARARKKYGKTKTTGRRIK